MTKSNSISIGGNVSGGIIAIGNENTSISTYDPKNADVSQKSIDDLLTELQNAIRQDTVLSSDEKNNLFEQVNALKQSHHLSADERKGIAQKAREIFDATLKGLPAAATIVESCGKILPMII